MVPVRNLIIIGFGGLGKEVHWLAARLGVNVRGFLDDNPDLLGAKFCTATVLGNVSNWEIYSDCEFIIAIGNPRVRKKIREAMLAHGVPQFATLIDPSAVVDLSQVSVGEGSLICAGTTCTVEINIGAHVVINPSCSIAHEVIIKDFVTLAPMVAVSGNVHIECLAEIGTGSCVRQGLDLGAGSMLGMGSVLTKNIPESELFYGNPAKYIRAWE
ncbi:acetyltransferase [Pseudomonas ogarae]|uniref:acetyltransferase n=1 Tax=Pseudomonas ogarae (strain DSM 112162 / CECT 30235 / F113) TaxID=1114970 RepID=UPI0009A42664|nr:MULTISPECIES: acetyltransferase [Pseudomonas]OPG69314.1 acetyltransferase [Pseudomonas ogarae]OPG79223.1 acetyltransferase [Pseudomonas ogarae]PBJ15297.1 putative acetyltransferase EpsM [Pseudomonas ogarae]PBJ22481.1 putative acetyltransferase EpsM [Pseudomonas ogarae]QXH96601.1 acetyltransferase [Pseudomonas zarinae]